MARRRFVRRAVLAGTIGLAGCGSGDGEGSTVTTPTTSPRPTLAADAVVDLSGPACEAIAVATFKSIEQREVGQRPDGTVVLGHWTVSFETDQYECVYGDVIETGAYDCAVDGDGARIDGERRDGDGRFTGRDDGQTGELEWDSVRFRPVEGT